MMSDEKPTSGEKTPRYHVQQFMGSASISKADLFAGYRPPGLRPPWWRRLWRWLRPRRHRTSPRYLMVTDPADIEPAQRLIAINRGAS